MNNLDQSQFVGSAAPEYESSDETPLNGHAAVYAGKRPFHSQFIDSMAEEEDSDSQALEMEDQPDLALYFTQWEISIPDQISLCRKYADYLRAKEVVRDPSLKGKRFK